MLLVRFLFGVGEAGAYPTLARVTGDWFPVRERAVAQGGIWFSARIGGAIAPLVLGRLAAAWGWRQAFFVLGVIGVAWAVVFWYWFRDRPSQHPAANEAERDLIRAGAPPHDASVHAWPGWADVRPGIITLIAMCSASFWVCFGWYFYPTWQPEYLKDVHRYEPSGWMSEVLTGLPFLCGAVGALSGGLISDRLVTALGPRWGRSAVGLVGFIGAGVCVLLTGFVSTAWAAVTLLCLAFLINDLAIPVIWASCADVGGRFAGSLSGTMNMAGGFGAMLSPLLIPYVLDWLPTSFAPEMRWRIVFAGLAAAWFLAAASWLFIDASCRLGRPGSSVISDQLSVISDQSSASSPAITEHIASKPDGVQPRTDGVHSTADD
jgi:MFS family permease